MSEISVTERQEQPTAVVRARVALDELPSFFGHAFADVMRALGRQDTQPSGPPFGMYHDMPTDTVDVEAGFPVPTPITADDDVTPSVLPGGKVVEAEHVGSYDTLSQTYDELTTWIVDHGMTPGGPMWESYLTDPDAVPDPAAWRTLVAQPAS